MIERIRNIEERQEHVNAGLRKVAAATAIDLPVALSCAAPTLAQSPKAGHVLSLDAAMDTANGAI